MCTEYNSDLKIGANHMEMGSVCWAHRALFARETTSGFESLDFIPRVSNQWSVHLGMSTGHEKCLRPTDGGLFL